MRGHVDSPARPSYRVCPVGADGRIGPAVAGPYRYLDRAKVAATDLHSEPRGSWYERTYRDHFIVVETVTTILFDTSSPQGAVDGSL